MPSVLEFYYYGEMKKTPMNDGLKAQLLSLPDEPGVYLMRDVEGSIIYIGKAKSLVKRVRSYFRKSSSIPSFKTKLLVSRIDSLEVITTATEVEALMLESNLVKKHQPHFNVILKDDKHFPFLKLSVNEEFPRLSKVRKAKKDGSVYYGPYIPEGDANRTMALVRKLFPLRRCRGPVKPKPRPCVHFEIGQCSSPCTGKISQDEYQLIVKDVKMFLDGKMEILIESMEKEMLKASDELNFEKAILLRDRIISVRNSFHKQTVISTQLETVDVLGFYQEEELTVVEHFFIRRGRMLGRKSFILDEDEKPATILRSVILQIYGDDVPIPPKILVPFLPEEQDNLQKWLSESATKNVTITVPQRGKNRATMQMVQKNTELTFREALKHRNTEKNPLLLEKVRKTLGRDSVPRRFETFDISNIGGVMAVGSLITWADDGFQKQDHRRFRIRTIDGSNDLAMMAEIIERRVQRLIADDLPLPDVMVIDGGQGQVNVVAQLLADYGMTLITVVGIAKGRSKKKLPRNERPRDLDYLVKPDGTKIQADEMPEDVLHFFQRMRDEAHRYAIEYHRKLREKRHFRSVLDEIPGVGPKKKRILLTQLGSLQKIANSTSDELEAISGIDTRTARTIVTFFKNIGDETP